MEIFFFCHFNTKFYFLGKKIFRFLLLSEKKHLKDVFFSNIKPSIEIKCHSPAFFLNPTKFFFFFQMFMCFFNFSRWKSECVHATQSLPCYKVNITIRLKFNIPYFIARIANRIYINIERDLYRRRLLCTFGGESEQYCIIGASIVSLL